MYRKSMTKSKTKMEVEVKLILSSTPNVYRIHFLQHRVHRNVDIRYYTRMKEVPPSILLHTHSRNLNLNLNLCNIINLYTHYPYPSTP